MEQRYDINSYVQASIDDLRGSDTAIKFPNDPHITPLVGKQNHALFLNEVNNIFRSQNSLLDELILCADTVEQYAALIEYYQADLILPCKSLTLFINNEINIEQFQTLIGLISANNQTSLNLKSNSDISEENIRDLTNFILENPLIAIQITLPDPWHYSSFQRRLDEVMSDRLATQALYSYKNTPPKITESLRKPRKIPTSLQQLEADYEHEHEHEHEHQVEQAFDTAPESLQTVKSNTQSYLDFKTFVKNYPQFDPVQCQIFKFNQQKDELEDTLTNTFLKWINRRYKIPNNQKVTLSTEACAYLLKHNASFPDGLDLHRLPAGFFISVSLSKIEIWFDESARQHSEYDPLAVQVHPKLELPVITHQMFKTGLSMPESGAAIHKCWQQLSAQEKYVHTDHQTFKNYLPKMQQLANESAEKLLTACWDGDKFNASLLAFLLDNRQYIPTGLESDSDFDNYPTIAASLRKFSANLSLVRDFINSYQPQTLAPEQHLIFYLISPEQKTILQELIAAVPELDLNALLPLVSPAGNPGLERMHQLYLANPDAFIQLHTQIYLKNQRYAEWISEDTQEAIDIINALNPEEHELFEKLYTAHLENHSDVNLYDLAQAFKKFKQEIEELGLKVQGPFNMQHVKSLPNCLSNIITFLKHADPANRETLWLALKNMELANFVAMQTLEIRSPHNTNSAYLTHKSFAFVCPEMQLDVEHLRPQREEFENISNFTTISNAWSQPPAPEYPLAEIERRFFLYVAQQEHQLPLEFYLELKEIVEHSSVRDSVKGKLFAILASSTTGFTNVDISMQDLQRTRESLTECIRLMESVNANRLWGGRAINFLLDSLKKTQFPPPLYYLQNLLKFVSKNKFRPQKLKDMLEMLTSYANSYGTDIYHGMRDFTDTDFNRRDFYDEYIETMHRLKVMISNLNDETNIIKKIGINLIKLISTFNITPDKVLTKIGDKYCPGLENIAMILAEIDEQETLLKINEVLLILQYASKSLRPDLTLIDADIYKIIIDIKANNQVNAIDFVESYVTLGDQVPIAEFFPPDFFTTFRLKSIHRQDLEKIYQFPPNTQENIQKILLSFNRNKDNQHYHLILDALIKINKYVEPHVFKRLIDKLIANPDIFVNSGLSTVHPFIILLSNLTSKSSIQNLCILLSTQQKKPQRDPRLVEKALFLVKEAVPRIRGIPNLKVRALEYTPLLVTTVLHTPNMEMPAVGINYAEQAQDLEAAHQLLSKIQSAASLPNSAELARLDELNSTLHFAEITKLLTSLNKSESFLTTPPQKLAEDLSDSGRTDSEDLSSDNESLTEETQIDYQANIQEAISALQQRQQQAAFADNLSVHYAQISRIVQNHPTSHKPFLSLYNNYLEAYSATSEQPLLAYLAEFTNQLEHAFSLLKENEVLALCVQFNTKHKLQPQDFLDLLTYLQVDTTESAQSDLLKIAIALINTDKNFNLADFKKLCKLYKSDPETINKIFQRAPVPTTAQILAWSDEFHKLHGPSIYSTYLEFCKYPCHREESCGFDIEKAKQQWELFTGVPDSCTIDFEAFAQLTIDMREKDIGELLSIFHTKDQTPELLVASAAELYHRCNGKDKYGANEEFAPGSSMELNTTQYLTCLTALKSGSLVAQQMATGEGKTRACAITDVCKIAQGHTVDQLTSDTILARRDYLISYAFNSMLGIQTSLISSSSSPDDYVTGGMNYSDIYSINSFRNDAISKGLQTKVQDPVKEHRHATIDEGDKAFDMALMRINISAAADAAIRDMPWVYPLIVRYFNQESIRLPDGTITTPTAIYSDRALSMQKLMEFASLNCNKEQLERLKNVSTQILERWQKAALAIETLHLGKVFNIEEDRLALTRSGVDEINQAIMLIGGNPEVNSKFSKGVYQCLQAKLNLIKNGTIITADTTLNARLKACSSTEFDVPDEKSIIYSSSMIDMILDYGSILFMSGTTGHQLERVEAEALYSLDSSSQMVHIDVPRHKGLNREDTISLTANSNAHIQHIIEEIKVARSRNQPILIFTEDDIENQHLLEAISHAFPDDTNIQEVNSSTDLEDDDTNRAMFKKASQPGFITVATERASRGFDFAITPDSRDYGLHTIVSYLPKNARDLQQALGRSARMGQAGTTSLVLNQEKIPAYIYTDDSKTLQDKIAEHFNISTKKAQNMRLITINNALFHRRIRHAFYLVILPKLPSELHDKLKDKYGIWLGSANDEWGDYLAEIQELLKIEPIDIEAINEILAKYQETIQGSWAHFRNSIIAETKGIEDNPASDLMETLPALALSHGIELLLLGKTKEEATEVSQTLLTDDEPITESPVAINVSTKPKKSVFKSIIRGAILGIVAAIITGILLKLSIITLPFSLPTVLIVVGVITGLATGTISYKVFDNTSKDKKQANYQAEPETNFAIRDTYARTHDLLEESGHNKTANVQKSHKTTQSVKTKTWEKAPAQSKSAKHNLPTSQPGDSKQPPKDKPSIN